MRGYGDSVGMAGEVGEFRERRERKIADGKAGEKILWMVRHSHVPDSQESALGPASSLILEPSRHWQTGKKISPAYECNNRGCVFCGEA